MNIKTFLVLGIFLASFSAHGMEERNGVEELFNIASIDMQRAPQSNAPRLKSRGINVGKRPFITRLKSQAYSGLNNKKTQKRI